MQEKSPLPRQPTPQLSHFSAADYKCVYEPSSDTFLFLDALEKEQNYLRDLRPTYCVEIGSGSGCVVTFLCKLLGSSVPTLYFATDINPDATRATRRTCIANSASPVAVVRTSFVSGLRLEGKVDLLLFNPPYVPTETEEVGRMDLSAAWAGGVDGREVLDKLLPQLPTLLSERGCVYLVVLEENRPKELAAQMASYGFSAEVILQRRSFNELLYIIKYSRNNHI